MAVTRRRERAPLRKTRNLLSYYRRIFSEYFPREDHVWSRLSVDVSAECYSFDVAHLGIPSDVERYNIRLVLKDQSYVGISYTFAPSWGWLICVFNQKPRGTREWGPSRNDQFISDLCSALAESSPFARKILGFREMCMCDTYGRCGLAQYRLGGMSYLLGSRTTIAFSERIDKAGVVTAEHTETFSMQSPY